MLLYDLQIGKRGTTYIAILILHLLVDNSTAQGLRTPEIPRLSLTSMGINFNELLAQVHTTSSFYDLLFQVPLPVLKIPEELVKVKVCKIVQKHVVGTFGTRDFTKWDMLARQCRMLQNDCNDGVEQFNKRLPYLVRESGSLKLLLKQLYIHEDLLIQDSGRNPRAILGFLGKLAAPILGLTTTDDLQDVLEHVKALRMTAGDALKDLKHTKEFLGKMITHSNERFNQTWRTIREMKNTIDGLVQWVGEIRNTTAAEHNFEEYRHAMTETLLDMMYRINAAISDIDKQHYSVREWIRAVLLLHENKLSPFLISPETLSGELKVLGKSVKLRQMALHVLHGRNVGYFYEEKLVTTVVTNDTLYIHFMIPLGSEDSALRVFYADIYPIPFQPVQSKGVVKSEGFNKLYVEKPYLVVTLKGDGFIELSESELQACLRSAHFSCKALTALNYSPYKSCLYSLFIKDFVKATQICDFRAFAGTPETFVKSLDDGKFLIIGATESIIVTCLEGREVFPPAPMLILEVPCGCSVTTGYVYIQPVTSQCSVDAPILLGYLANLVHLITFALVPSNERALEIFQPNTEMMVADLPSLDLLPNYDQRMQADAQKGIAMLTAAEEIALRTSVLYGEEIVDITDGFKPISLTEMVIFIILALWLMGLTAGLGISAYYIRIIILLLKAQKLYAYKMYTTPSALPNPPLIQYDLIETDLMLFMINLGVLFILSGVAILGYVIVRKIIHYKYYTCTKCYSKVLLMCMDQKDSLNIEITTVPQPLACSKFVALPHPRVLGIKRYGLFSHAITFEWPFDMVINCYGHKYTYNMPDKVIVYWPLNVQIKKRWDAHSQGTVDFAIKIYQGCYCDPIVSGPISSEQEMNFEINSSSDSANDGFKPSNSFKYRKGKDTRLGKSNQVKTVKRVVKTTFPMLTQAALPYTPEARFSNFPVNQYDVEMENVSLNQLIKPSPIVPRRGVLKNAVSIPDYIADIQTQQAVVVDKGISYVPQTPPPSSIRPCTPYPK